MRILLINLDRHSERLAWMSTQLAALSLPFERIRAVDRLELPAAPAECRGITPGEYACTLSHFLCWRALLDGPDDAALVLEDDALLSPLLPRVLARCAAVPRNADLVRLETKKREVQLGNSAHVLDERFRLHRIYSAHRGTAGYIVTRKGAAALLRHRWAYTRPVDHVIFSPSSSLFRRLAVYQCKPAPVIQHNLSRAAGAHQTLQSDLATERDALAQLKKTGLLRATLDRVDSLALGLRDAVLYRRFSRLQGRHVTRVEFADAALDPVSRQ